MKLNIQLSDHFTYKKLLRFTLPSIAMMIFTSIYGVVDGFFVSNFVGKTPFAAVNFIMPFLMILGAFGFMPSSRETQTTMENRERAFSILPSPIVLEIRALPPVPSIKPNESK